MNPESPSRSSFQVDVEPVGRRVVAEEGQTLLQAAQAAGVEMAAVCGGAGLCGKCRVHLMTGRLSAPTARERTFLSDEDLSAGQRLACQCHPLSDVKVSLPPESLMSAQRLQVEGIEERFESQPVIVGVHINLEPPSLSDLRSDATRLEAAVTQAGRPESRLGLPILAELSTQLREQDWEAEVAMCDAQVVGVLPPGIAPLGLAVDIGTTKMAAYLVNLGTGDTLARGGVVNPQVPYGEDVLSRIAHANQSKDGRKTLQSVVVERLNELAGDLCRQAQVDRRHIVEAVVVGNTAMHHLFAGLPVRQLGFVPYVPAVSEALRFPGREIGLEMAPGGHVFLPPNIAGFVGADHVAMLVAVHAGQVKGHTLAIDIGTNTEICLVSDGRMLCCSCASGPAFEGAHIRDGMRAVPGAIEKVVFREGVIYTQTVGGMAPVGLCGSGILDAVSGLYGGGILDRSGRMSCPDGPKGADGTCRTFTLVGAADSGHGRDITVTQEDVREIQLAKGAIRTGIEILLGEVGLAASELDRFIVAGAFGTYLDLESAMRIGMFPQVPLERYQQVGNAAGMGAKLMLTSRAKRAEAADIAERIGYVELTTHSAFTKTFAHALRF